jgi:maltose alpha-D-glucosyltransferase/alpha-amylase
VWSDTDRKYAGTRIIFLDTEKSNWTFDEQAGQYYWHRFYSHQPDLNYDNPRVQEEMIDVARFWLEMGIDGFRADAVPYLFEREGTNSENLPETHAYLKRLRAFIDENHPGRILLCEANQWPEDVRPYFGDGDEFHMGFHFPIMPRIFMALKKGRAEDMIEILRRTPDIPESCQWCIFLRNHDELTLEMVTEEERQWMWKEYAPEPRMKLNLGIRRRLAPLLDYDRQRIQLANSILFTLPGSPILYYGDEIGMADNLDLPDRNGVRTPMQWNDTRNAGFTTGEPFSPLALDGEKRAGINVADQLKDETSLLHSIRRMIQIRKKHPALSRGTMDWIKPADSSLAVYRREYRDQSLLIVNNLGNSLQTVSIPLDSDGGYVDLFSDSTLKPGDSRDIPPHGFLWLVKQ